MAELKKNQINNILAVMVDATDFASVESGLDAADIDIKLYGVAQGVSTAASTITVSKAATLVRSGLFQITLKAGETDSHDHFMLRLSSTSTVSAATQYIPLTMVDNDDSDIYSAISDMRSTMDSQFAVTSNYLSNISNYVSSISAIASDAHSAAAANSDFLSDIDSALTSQFNYVSNAISDLHSDFQSRVPKLVATDSQVSALISDVQSQVSNLESDVVSRISRLDLALVSKRGSTASTVANASALEIDGIDHDSQFNGMLVRVLGGSQIEETKLIKETNATTSQIVVIPPFNSRVVSGVDYVILGLGQPWQSAMASDLTSKISDVESALDSQFAVVSNYLSNASNYLSSISAIASDAHSAAAANSDFLSDIDSAVTSQFNALSNMISDAYSGLSDVLSKMGGPEHIASLVWDADKGSYVDASSMGSVLQAGTATPSAVADKVWSDFQSKAGPSISNFVSNTSNYLSSASNMLSSISAIASDAHSAAAANSDFLSDIDSALTSQFNSISNAISDLHSDFQSRVPKRVATDSQLSDLASDIKSAVSNVESALDSQFLVYQSDISDVISSLNRLDATLVTHRGSTASATGNASSLEIDGINHASQFNGQYIRIINGSQIDEVRLILNTDLTNSRLTVAPAFNSAVASGVDFEILAHGQPWQSVMHSDLRSHISSASATVAAASASNIASKVWEEKYSDYTVASSMGSKLGSISGDVSDMASAVWAEKYRVHSLASSFGSAFSDMWTNAQQASSRALINQSRISDVDSALTSQFNSLSNAISDLHSDFQSRVPKKVATDSQLSDLASDLKSAVSNVESALDSQFLVYQSDISDVISSLNRLDSTLVTHRGSTASATGNASSVEIDGINHASQFNGQLIRLLGGSQIDEVRLIVDTDFSNSRLVVSPAFNSAVASAVDFEILAHGQPTISNLESNLASKISDVDSAVTSQFNALSNMISDAYSGLSDTLSKMGGPEHIASLVWDADKGSYVDASSMGSVLQAGTATPSAVADKVWSDYQSKVGRSVSDVMSELIAISDTLSKMGGPEHIASLVWDADKGSYVDASSMGSVLQAGTATPSAVADKVWSDFASKAGPSVSDFVSNVSHMLSNASDILSDTLSAAQEGSSRALVNQSQISDVDSALTSQFNYLSNVISDLHSDFQSRVPKRVATDSQLSALVSDVQSQISNLESDVVSRISRLDLALVSKRGSTASTVANASALEIDGIDHHSQFNGMLVRILSGSQIEETKLIKDTNVTTSQIIVIPPFNSRVLSGVDYVILGLGQPWQSAMASDLASKVSDVDSALTSQFNHVSDMLSSISAISSDAHSAAAANSDFLSDIDSALTSQFNSLSNAISDLHSDFQSRVPKRVATDSQLSDVHSDLRSQISGITASVSASDISDIASRVWSEKHRVHSLASSFGSLFSVVATGVDNTESRTLRTMSDTSELVSRVTKEVASKSLLSDVQSDLTSQIAGVSAQVSDVESAIDSQFTVYQSDMSDVISGVSNLQSRVPQVVATSDVQSDIYSLLSDLQSDFQSRVPKELASKSLLSDVQSDLQSRIAAVASDLPNRPTKNVALSNFDFLMVDSTDKVTGKTGLTVTGQIRKDAGSFAAITNSPTEVANGIYSIDLTATEMNADKITLRFSGTGALDRFITILTKPT